MGTICQWIFRTFFEKDKSVMITVDLDYMIEVVEARTGVKLTLTRISEDTGGHRKILSKVYNDPTSKVSSETLGSLIEYFFHILRHSPQRPRKADVDLMDWVKINLISIYPESNEYLRVLPELFVKGMEGGKSPRYSWMYFSRVQKEEVIDLVDDEYEEFTEEIKVSDQENHEENRLIVQALLNARFEEDKAKKRSKR